MPRASCPVSDESSDQMCAEAKQKRAQVKASLEVVGMDEEAINQRVIVSEKTPELALSSTAVRRAIVAGEYEQAARMLGNDCAASYVFWATHEVDDMKRKFMDTYDGR